MKVNNTKLANRWNDLTNDIGLEHLGIGTNLSELETNKQYYGVENGITTEWLLK